jgi:hypothetical protein
MSEMNWAQTREFEQLCNARLIILKELGLQSDGKLNERLLQLTLDAFGHRHSIEWLRQQLAEMQALGALKTAIINDNLFTVATITTAGVNHLERRAFIEGIAKPSLGV